MEQYTKIDSIVEDMTAQDLADYLINNWEEYAEELASQLSLQIIINGEDNDKQD